MPCEFCRTREDWDRLATKLGTDIKLNYCPVCGEASYIKDFLEWMRAANDAAIKSLMTALPDTILDENGNELKFERAKSTEKKPVKPMDMSIDLDKVNIDYEMSLIQSVQRERVIQTIDYLLNKGE